MTTEEAIECLKKNKPTSGYIMLQVSVDMAIEALEKQISKKPISQIRLFGLDKGGRCPTCKKYINNNSHWMHCECGQKIDWD